MTEVQLHRDLVITCRCGLSTNLDIAINTFSYNNGICSSGYVWCQAKCAPCGIRFWRTKKMNTFETSLDFCVCKTCKPRIIPFCVLCGNYLEHGGCVNRPDYVTCTGERLAEITTINCGECGNCFYEVCNEHFFDMGDNDEIPRQPCKNRKAI